MMKFIFAILIFLGLMEKPFDLQLFADDPAPAPAGSAAAGDTTLEGLKKQLVEIIPSLTNAKAVISQAEIDSKTLVDLGGKIKNMDEMFLKMEKAIANLGKRDTVGGTDPNQLEVDFVKWVSTMVKARRGQTEDHKKTLIEMMGKYGDEKQKAALNEATNAQGGYLVPRAFAKEIMRVADQASVALRMSTRSGLTTGFKLPVLRELSSVSVSFVAEAGPVGESEPTFAEDLISALKLMAYSKLSNELIEDEDVGIFPYLTTIFGEAIGNKIDEESFDGDGTNFTGVLNATGVNSVTMTAGETFASTDFDNLSDVIAQLKEASLIGAWFFLHRTILNILRKAKLGSGGNLVRDWFPPANGQPGTIWGYPYQLVEQMPSTTAWSTPFLFLGNLKKLFIGEKSRDMTIKVTDIPAILTDQTLFVVRKRFAIDVALPAAFSVLKTGAVS